jgi:hypothetical protein
MKKYTNAAAIRHDGNQIYPYWGPQFNASGLMKSGAVNAANQAPINPTPAANPKVYDLRLCLGSSPPTNQAKLAMPPLYDTI